MHIKTKKVMKSVNQIRFVALVAAVAILLGGCEKESDNTVDNAPVAARITSTIDDMATRAAGTAWAAGDAIGVSGITGMLMYINVKYVTTKGDGKFTVVNDAGQDNNIYFQDKESATFTAYYPFDGKAGTAPGANGIISKSITDADQTADGQPQIDYLFATAIGSVASPDVKFQFKHCMSRIILNFLPGNGIASLSDLRYTIDALALEGTFNTKTGATAGTTTGNLMLSVSNNASEMSSTLIVFPQRASGANIKITMNGVDYMGRIDYPENADNSNTRELRAGYSYTYNVKMNNGSLGIELADINEWGNGGNTDINTTN
mgnify:FL=1